MKALKWIEISEQNLIHNLQTIRQRVGNQVLLAAGVKADAFSHGIIKTSQILLQNGADWLFVNSAEEAELIRNNGIRNPILIAAYIQKNQLADILNLGNIRFLIYNKETVDTLAQYRNQTIHIHIMVDTGMHRQGILPSKLTEFIDHIKNTAPNIIIEGMATHFASADEIDTPEYFQHQMEKFKKAVLLLQKQQTHIPYLHAANSAASLVYPQSYFNFIRPAAAIYGIYPSNKIKEFLNEKNIKLKPTLQYKTKVARVETLPSNSFVGYNQTYRTSKPTRIALLPVGFNEGIRRELSNRGEVLISGKRAKIIGRISMHMTVVDITDLQDVQLEDEVVIIGQQGNEEITCSEMAELMNTIEHEIMCGIPADIPRIYR